MRELARPCTYHIWHRIQADLRSNLGLPMSNAGSASNRPASANEAGIFTPQSGRRGSRHPYRRRSNARTTTIITSRESRT
jgi:hypothetical protein